MKAVVSYKETDLTLKFKFCEDKIWKFGII